MGVALKANDVAAAADALAVCWAHGERRQVVEPLLIEVVEMSAVLGAAALVNSLKTLSGESLHAVLVVTN